jgi:PAS domain S-box-containing protein
VVATLNKGGQANNNSADKEAYIQVSWNRLAVQTRGIIFDASCLLQMLQDQENQVKQTSTLFIMGLLGAFGAFILALFLLINGRVIKSIANLQVGTKVIGSGNLDYSIKVKKGDEIGDLADAFNQMTARLKSLTASKADLENEITERKRAESAKEQLLAQLRAKTAELQDVNEMIEVKNEELAAQAEELACTNEELQTHNEELQSVTQSLHETQNYLESLINNANAPIIVWDPRFTITRFNKAFEWLSGYTAEEVIGKDLSILFPADSREETLDKIKKTLEGEQWESVEIPILHKYGNVRIALWNSANIYDNDHNLLATIAQGQDITRRKQAEKELEESKVQAELYLDLMGHDISNMHQIIMMQMEIAQEIFNTDGKLECEDREIIDSSARTLEKAARLIDNVRKLQKLRSGEYKLEAVDLAATLNDVLKDYSSIPGREITIKYSPDGKWLVLANPLLRDVFSNLVDNAVKHSGDPLEIVVDVKKTGLNGTSYYRVAIEDNGNGIPDDKKEEVFHRFRQGQTKARGTGLGLYLVKSLVEGFGGYVEIQDRVLRDYTKGTRFLVYLPVIEEAKNAADK